MPRPCRWPLRRTLTLLFLGAGVALGVWHLRLATQAVVVFAASEPLSSWVSILGGPASTLPAVLLAVFWRRGGGAWLVTGSAVSCLALLVTEGGATEALFPFLWMIGLPMLLVGAMLLPRQINISL